MSAPPPAAPAAPQPPVAAPQPVQQPSVQPRPQPTPPPAKAPPPPAAKRPVNPFLSQDPDQKARRLARALISDLAVYYPDRRREGLQNGRLKELFEEEIKKSWEEYTEQIGKELAESSTHFTDALNEILAGGRKVF